MHIPCLRVAVVDDDEGDLELFRRCLEMLPKYRIDLVALSQPQQALDLLLRETVDIVFLDYQLGKSTGLELLRQLRAAECAAPMVMLTGQGDEQLAVELMKAGATDYLAKARLAPETLDQVLRNAMRIVGLERQAALAEEKQRLAAKVFDNVLEGVLVTDADARILSVNPAFTAITGYGEAELLGKNPNILRSNFHDQAFYQNMWHDLMTSGQWKGEIWNNAKSGNAFLMWQTISAVKNNAGRVTHYVSVLFDITERRRHEDNIRHQAYHDELTDLPNRRLFFDRLTLALVQARREGEMLALMFIDLDNFKQVNDLCGHDIGDQLLKQVAEQLKDSMRKGDTLSRFGGDEFVLLLPQIKATHNAILFAEKIIRIFSTPLDIAGHRLDVKASIGISLYPRDSDEPETLVKMADAAMYAAKQSGRNRYMMAGH